MYIQRKEIWIVMGIIQCAEECKFQSDGYCGLDKLSTVGLVQNGCPHFVPTLAYNRNCFTKTYNADKL